MNAIDTSYIFGVAEGKYELALRKARNKDQCIFGMSYSDSKMPIMSCIFKINLLLAKQLILFSSSYYIPKNSALSLCL
jgi:hypothetical protein